MDRGVRARVRRGPLSAVAAPAERAVAPLVAAAGIELDACFDRSVVAVLPSARRDIAALLTRRLVAIALRVLVHEQHALTATGMGLPSGDASDAWRDRFARYPVLAELVTGAIADFGAHIAELLARLGADRERIAAELFGGRPLGALAGFRGDAGDVHDGGRAVGVLRFDDGRGVVYKPKDLRVVGAVLELCAWLGPDLPLALVTRGFLARDGYAWEDLVEPAPCRSLAEVGRYYTRIGMLVALFELLEARDCWLDNLVAAGEHPAFIDLEMVLQPRPRARTSALAAEQAAEDRLRDSVVQLGMLAMPTLIAPGIAAEDICAVTPARAFHSPFRWVPALEAMTGADRPSRDGYLLWTHDAHAPTLRGEPVRAADHLDAVLDGYRAMRRTIAARADDLLAPGGPIDRLAGLVVRVIQRNTWTCYRIVQASLAPRLLASFAARDAWLAGLADGATGDHRAVAAREIAALRRLDVPYFVCRSDGADLLEPDGTPVARGWFEGSALDRVRRRIRGDTAPAPACDDLVRSTFATSLRPPRGDPPPELVAPGEPPDWIAEATAVGDLIIAEAIRAGDGLTWIGLTVEPFHALRRIDVLGPDLLTGTAGIAIVLAELWATTGLERFRDAAIGAIAVLRHSRRDEPLAGAPPAIGAFYGTGARIYALHRCAVALADPQLAAAALALAGATAVPAGATLDVATGATGLLLASLAAGADVAALADWIDAHRDLHRSPYPPELRELDGLPDLGEGLALAGARLGVPRWSAQRSARLESREIDSALGRGLVARHRAHGRWFPGRLVADRHDLSAISGLAALAHGFLRLAAPSRVPSIRLIEPA